MLKFHVEIEKELSFKLHILMKNFILLTELVPDTVKRELLAEIKRFLAAQTQ